MIDLRSGDGEIQNSVSSFLIII